MKIILDQTDDDGWYSSHQRPAHPWLLSLRGRLGLKLPEGRRRRSGRGWSRFRNGGLNAGLLCARDKLRPAHHCCALIPSRIGSSRGLGRRRWRLLRRLQCRLDPKAIPCAEIF